MAFLIPQNIPSRNDLPARLQAVARALRDSLPDEATVWLERSGTGDRAALALEFDIDFDQESSPANQEPFLLVFDPEAGIAVLETRETPPVVARGGQNCWLSKASENHPVEVFNYGSQTLLRGAVCDLGDDRGGGVYPADR